MKKATIYLAIIMYAVFFTKCINDTGNYSYQDADAVAPIILSEFEANYTALMLESFVLDPQVQGNEADYEYFWVAYPHGTTTQNRRDTIGRERKLDYKMALAPGQYKLIFQAKDKQTGTSAYMRTIITVSSVFSLGYFVNKYENGRTDVDFVDGSGVLHSNILKTINGDDLPGKPIRSTFSDRYCYQTIDDEGKTVANNWVYMFMLCTDEDMRIYKANDMTMLYDWDHAFMELPAVKKPQGVWGNSSGFMLLNNNQLHSVGGATYSDGRFGYAYPDEGIRLSEKGCTVTSNMMFLNENTGSIVGYSTTQDRYAYTQPYPGYEQHHFTNQEVLYFGTQHNYLNAATRGWALLRSKNEGEIGKLRLVDAATGSFNTYRSLVYFGSYQVPSEFNVGDGKVFCVQNGGGTGAASSITSILYYSTGDNKVHYYNQNNQTQKLNAVTIPDDEKIVYIYHNYDWACNNHPSYYHADAPNEFLVLSNKADSWILRAYAMEGTTHDINAAAGPKKVYTGNGLATNLIYREPHTMRTW